MRSFYLIPFLMAVFLGYAGSASAQAVVADYAGDYTLLHDGVSLDFDIYVTVPGYEAFVIPVELDVTFENQQIPWEEFSQILDSVQSLLEKYGVPIQIESKILTGLDKLLDVAWNALNEKMSDLPDLMVINTLPRGNVVTVNFIDEDGSGRQFTLTGTLNPDTGELILGEHFYAQIDPEAGFSGAGDFDSGDIDVEQMVKGVNLRLAGAALEYVKVLHR